MKKLLFSLLMLFLFQFAGNAQVGIGTTSPDESSLLELNSTSQGVLIPRMTTAERLNINHPANGLLVYDLTTNSLWYCKDEVWNEVSYSPTGNLWSRPGTSTWLTNTVDNVGIGTTNPLYKMHMVASFSPVFRFEGGPAPSDGPSIVLAKGATDQVILNGTGINPGLHMPNGGRVTTSGGGAIRLLAESGSTNQLYLATNGNIGMGTTNPTVPLVLSRPAATVQFNLEGTGTYQEKIQFTHDGTAIGSLYNDGTAGGLNLFAFNDLRFRTNEGSFIFVKNYNPFPLELLRITDDGRIGMGTTDPTNPLHITTNNPLRLEGIQQSTDTEALVVGANGVIYKNPSIGTGSGLWTRNGTNTYLTNTTDNVGIGTTAPSSKFEITAPFNPVYKFGALGTNPSDGPSISLLNGSTERIRLNASLFPTLYLYGQSRITTNNEGTLGLGADGTYNQVFLATTGNVGIGTTASMERVTINGNIIFTKAADRVISIQNGISGADNGKNLFIRAGGAETSQPAPGYLYLDGGSSPVGYGNVILTYNRALPNGQTGRVGVRTQNPNSSMHIEGSVSTVVLDQDKDYDVTEYDHIIRCLTDITLTLPAANSCKGREYIFKRVYGISLGTTTIATTAGQTIDGSTTYVLNALNKYVRVVSDGTNWMITGSN